MKSALGVAETYDVIVQPRDDKAYTIFAQPESRGSYARGTLAPRMGMTAEVPPMDPYPLRTMTDMGMGGMANMKGISGVASGQTPGTTHMQMAGMSDSPMSEVKDMKRGAMNDGDMSAMGHAHMDHPAQPSNDQLTGMTPFPQPGPRTTRLTPPPSQTMSHPTRTMGGEVPLHVGPEVVMVAKETSPRLHNSGDGLNGNGRRVLTYSDLRALYKGVDGRPPTREIILHLTGNMQRFIWGFDGRKFSQAEPTST